MKRFAILGLALLLGGCAASYVGDFKGVSPRKGMPEGAKTVDLSVKNDKTWQLVVHDQQGQPLRTETGSWQQKTTNTIDLLDPDGRFGRVWVQSDGVILQMSGVDHIYLREK
jgi:hypothetical protein